MILLLLPLALSRSFLTVNNITFSLLGAANIQFIESKLLPTICYGKLSSDEINEIKRNLQADHVLSRYTQKAVQQKEPFYSGKTDDSCNLESGYKNHKTNQQNVNI